MTDQAPEQPRRSVLGRLAFRSTVFGIAVVAGLLTFFFFLMISLPGRSRGLPSPLEVAAIAGVGFLVGFVFQGASAVELYAEALPTRRFDVPAAIAATALAGVLICVISLQIVYTMSVARTGDLEQGYVNVLVAVKRFVEEPLHSVTNYGPMAIPFGPVTFCRLRRMSVGKQAVLGAVVTAVVVFPLIAILLKWQWSHGLRIGSGSWHDRLVEELWVRGAIPIAEALALPVVFRLADSTEARVSSWLARRRDS